MSERVIRDVGATLIELLRRRLGTLVNSPQQIALSSPVNAEEQGIRLTLFLYSITPTAELRNAPPTRVGAGEERRAPLPLDLYYLLTAFAPDTIQDPSDRTLEAHRLLGAAMQVFYDSGMLSGGVLQGHLRPRTELRLTLQPITVEDLTRIWSVFPEENYRPSVSYLVTPAQIDSQTLLRGRRVISKQTDLDRMVPHPVGAS